MPKVGVLQQTANSGTLIWSITRDMYTSINIWECMFNWTKSAFNSMPTFWFGDIHFFHWENNINLITGTCIPLNVLMFEWHEHCILDPVALVMLMEKSPHSWSVNHVMLLFNMNHLHRWWVLRDLNWQVLSSKLSNLKVDIHDLYFYIFLETLICWFPLLTIVSCLPITSASCDRI